MISMISGLRFVQLFVVVPHLVLPINDAPHTASDAPSTSSSASSPQSPPPPLHGSGIHRIDPPVIASHSIVPVLYRTSQEVRGMEARCAPQNTNKNNIAVARLEAWRPGYGHRCTRSWHGRPNPNSPLNLPGGICSGGC
jgi:hypothetical protein